MTYSKEFLDLYNNLFALIEYPEDLAQEVASVSDLWKEFCALPVEVKKQFSFRGQHEDWNSGYILRSSDSGYDEKEYYHFQPNHKEILRKAGLVKTMTQYSVVADFFTSCEQVLEKLRVFVLDHVKKIAHENQYLKELPEQFVKGFEQNLVVLRFLHYTPQTQSPILAESHFDIGGMTFHVYENSEGLQFMDFDGLWKDAPLVKGHTVMFNAYGLESMSGGVLQRTWHRVVPTEHQTQERYSAVFFADFPDNPNWDTTLLGRAKFQPMEYAPKKEI